MTNDGITAITLTTDEGSVTVSPDAFDRYADSLKRGKSMTTATTCHACGHASSEHRPRFGCVEATWVGDAWTGCPCTVESVPVPPAYEEVRRAGGVPLPGFGDDEGGDV